MIQHTRWRVDQDRGWIDCAGLRCAIDARQPSHGVSLVSLSPDAATLGEVLGVILPGAGGEPTETLVEAYAHGGDFVAIYTLPGADALRMQIVWRLAEAAPGALLAIDAVISVQTARLESQPTSRTQTVVLTREVLCHEVESGRAAASAQRAIVPLELGEPGRTVELRAEDAAYVIFRFDKHAASYVEMIHPSDHCGATLSRRGDGQTMLAWNLFPESLEKGVIRRARVRGLVVPRDRDAACAAEAYSEFVRGAPPLD